MGIAGLLCLLGLSVYAFDDGGLATPHYGAHHSAAVMPSAMQMPGEDGVPQHHAHHPAAVRPSAMQNPGDDGVPQHHAHYNVPSTETANSHHANPSDSAPHTEASDGVPEYHQHYRASKPEADQPPLANTAESPPADESEPSIESAVAQEGVAKSIQQQHCASSGTCEQTDADTDTAGPDIPVSIELQLLGELGRGIGTTQVRVRRKTTVAQVLASVSRNEGLPIDVLELRHEGVPALLDALVDSRAQTHNTLYQVGLRPMVKKSETDTQVEVPKVQTGNFHLKITMNPNLGRGFKRHLLKINSSFTPNDVLRDLSDLEGIPYSELQLGYYTRGDSGHPAAFHTFNRTESFEGQNATNATLAVLSLAQTKDYSELTYEDSLHKKNSNGNSVTIRIEVDDSAGLSQKFLELRITTSSTGHDVREQISQVEGIPLEEIVLEMDFLQAYPIQDNDIVYKIAHETGKSLTLRIKSTAD